MVKVLDSEREENFVQMITLMCHLQAIWDEDFHRTTLPLKEANRLVDFAGPLYIKTSYDDSSGKV